MKGIRCIELQNDFRTIRDDPRYDTFTKLYNKLNENYRTMIAQGILKPVSIFKRKISQVDSDQGGRGPGGQYGGGRGRDRGRGSQGRGADRNINMSKVNMQCLPPNIDLNDLSFSDEQWYGFSDEQRDTVTALRRLRINKRQPQRTDKDDISSLDGSTNGG